MTKVNLVSVVWSAGKLFQRFITHSAKKVRPNRAIAKLLIILIILVASHGAGLKKSHRGPHEQAQKVLRRSQLRSRITEQLSTYVYSATFPRILVLNVRV